MPSEEYDRLAVSGDDDLGATGIDTAHDFTHRDIGGHAQPRRHRIGHAAIRTYLCAEDDDYVLMPGGLVRYAPTAEPMELSISAGEGSKDLWVLTDGHVPPVTLFADKDKPVNLRRTSAIFPSRVADDLFWFGHSLDRADFLARISHEIRTPLSAIIGFAEIMQEERFGPLGSSRYKDYLTDILSSGAHVVDLVNDLLDL